MTTPVPWGAQVGRAVRVCGSRGRARVEVPCRGNRRHESTRVRLASPGAEGTPDHPLCRLTLGVTHPSSSFPETKF